MVFFFAYNANTCTFTFFDSLELDIGLHTSRLSFKLVKQLSSLYMVFKL
jgi:hypothetical protein